MKYKELVENDQQKMNTAYWISPTGRIFDTKGDFHIKSVIDYPHKFGMTDEYVESVYKKHGEWDEDKSRLGEGNAREELIVQLTKMGWIRMRFYPRQFMWSVTLDKLSGKTKDYMYKWAQRQMGINAGKGKGSPHADVKFTFTGDAPMDKSYTVVELSQDVLMNESESASELIEVESVEEFEDIPTYDFAKE